MTQHRVYIVILLMTCTGCASTLYEEGTIWLQRENYDAALKAFQKGLTETPEETRIKRELGVAYYWREEYEQAQKWLQDAQEEQPDDGKTYLFRGMTYEKQERYEQAERMYESFLTEGRSGRYRNKIQARLNRMKQRVARQKIEWAQDNVTIDDIRPNTVAVMRFKYGGQDAKLRPLGAGIAFFIRHALSQIDGIIIVERGRIGLFEKEFQLATILDAETASRAGKLLEANWIIRGDYGPGAVGWLYLDMTPYEAKIDDLRPPFPQEVGREEDQIELEDRMTELVEHIAEDLMGLELPEGFQIEPFTESFEAFLAFSEGLEYLDQGRYNEAVQKFNDAYQRDPNFNDAHLKPKQQEAEVESDFQTIVDLKDFERDLVQTEIEETDDQELLENTSPAESVEASESQQPQPSDPARVDDKIPIRIHVNF